MTSGFHTLTKAGVKTGSMFEIVFSNPVFPYIADNAENVNKIT